MPGRRSRRALAVACGLALALSSVQAAQARLGDLDPSFGAGGFAQPDVGAGATQFEAVTTRADGQPVAAGWALNSDGFADAVVAQLTNAGAPDLSFGTAGVTRVADARLYDVSVAADTSARVLAAGSRALLSNGPTAPFAMRLTEGGAPDDTFANGLSLFAGEAHAIVPLAGGKALVAGWRTLGGTPAVDVFFVARLADTGLLDTSASFGDGGMVEVRFPGGDARAAAMAVDPAGRIVLAGWASATVAGVVQRQPALARLTPTGARDLAFGANGLVTLPGANPDGSAVGELRAVALDGAGRITAAGVSDPYAFVARRLANGAPDGSFGSGGTTYGAVQGRAALSGLALDGSRTLVVGATAQGRSTSELLLGSLDAAGAPEPALGGAPPSWRSFPSPAGGGAGALSVALGPAGTVYTAGALSGPQRPYLSRHLPNAAPSAALASPAVVQAGEPATFDAAGSSDPEGEPLRYAFDLDGNGSHEFDGGQNPLALRSFPAAGTYTVGVQVTDPRGASATASRGIVVTVVTAVPALVPQPVLGEQGVARLLRGSVRIRLPGTTNFVPLVALSAIPNGTEIDARNGRLLLTVLHDASGLLDGVRLHAGRFVFRQGQGAVPVTTLRLSGGSFARCASGASRSMLARTAGVKGGTGKRNGKPVRKLWGDGRGRFRTRGRYGAATVRGTKWLTLDRCDGTIVRVVRGKVSVRDLVRPGRKPKLVTAGGRFLVPAR